MARSRGSYSVIKAWSPFSISWCWFPFQPAFLSHPWRSELITYQLSHSCEESVFIKRFGKKPWDQLVHVSISEPMTVVRRIDHVIHCVTRLEPGIHCQSSEPGRPTCTHSLRMGQKLSLKAKYKFCHQKRAWLLVGQIFKCSLNVKGHIYRPFRIVQNSCFL